MKCGIYLITNKLNGKRYVGKSSQIERRLRHHLGGYGQSYALSRAVKKYGRDAFTCEVLEECERPLLGVREAYWFNKLQPEYNIAAIDERGRLAHSAESRAKMSRALKGKKLNLSPKERERRRRFMSELPRTPEMRAKMREASRKRVRAPHSEAHRKAIADGHRGKKHTEEWRRANSEAHKGKAPSPETRAKMSRARRGRPHSEDHRKANSEAQKAAWIKRRQQGVQMRDTETGKFVRGDTP